VDAVPVIKSLRCPKCGGALELRSAAARTVVCGYCAAQLDLTSPDYAFLERLRKEPLGGPLAAKLPIGLEGVIDEVPYRVSGAIRWQDGEARWEDYFLAGPAGHTAWIRYDHFSYRLFQLFKPLDAAPIEMQTVDPRSQYVDFGGGFNMVLDRKHAHVAHLEGELPWRVRMGEELVVLRCEGLSVEVSPAQVRYFRWSVVPWAKLAAAFGLPASALRPDPGPLGWKGMPGLQLFYGGLVVFVFGMIVAGLAIESCPAPVHHGITGARRRLGLHDEPLRTLKP
jgi:hypothetical protein